MWIAAAVCICGIVFRTIQLYCLTKHRQPPGGTASAQRDTSRFSPEEQKLERVAAFQNSLLGKHPVMAVVSVVFHTCLFVAPIFLVAHNLLLFESWGITFLSLPDGLCDVLTIVMMGCCLFFLVRRIAVPKVKAVSRPYDYLLLLITAAPFVSGFFAYHQLLDYKTIITLHVLAGEVMLVAMPFTKLGHMVFFFFVRILLGGEYSFGPGSRTWAS